MRPALRQVDVDAAVSVARFAADQLLAEAADPEADLTLADRRGLLTIAAAVDREVTRWAGLEPRSPEAQAVINKALAAVLPQTSQAPEVLAPLCRRISLRATFNFVSIV